MKQGRLNNRTLIAWRPFQRSDEKKELWHHFGPFFNFLFCVHFAPLLNISSHFHCSSTCTLLAGDTSQKRSLISLRLVYSGWSFSFCTSVVNQLPELACFFFQKQNQGQHCQKNKFILLRLLIKGSALILTKAGRVTTTQSCAGGGAEVSNLQSATSAQLPGPPTVRENINPQTLLALVKIFTCLPLAMHLQFKRHHRFVNAEDRMRYLLLLLLFTFFLLLEVETSAKCRLLHFYTDH